MKIIVERNRVSRVCSIISKAERQRKDINGQILYRGEELKKFKRENSVKSVKKKPFGH